jgi:hypothetical protein
VPFTEDSCLINALTGQVNLDDFVRDEEPESRVRNESMGIDGSHWKQTAQSNGALKGTILELFSGNSWQR